MLRDTSNHPIHPGNLHRRVFLSTARQGKGMRSEPKDSHTHIARTRAPRSALQPLLALLLLCLLTACSATAYRHYRCRNERDRYFRSANDRD